MEPLPLIMKGGLNKMARQHIHMALGMPSSGVISGMRNSCQVVVEVNMAKAMFGPHKIPFWVSYCLVAQPAARRDGQSAVGTGSHNWAKSQWTVARKAAAG